MHFDEYGQCHVAGEEVQRHPYLVHIDAPGVEIESVQLEIRTYGPVQLMDRDSLSCSLTTHAAGGVSLVPPVLVRTFSPVVLFPCLVLFVC